MTSEMSVPLSRAAAVMPGEEVDVAVEMTAPAEHGRYLGYWRLTGPYMRRKFGQRVWCHVQVVDPTKDGAEAFDDLQGVLAEIEKKKSDLAAGDEAADDDVDNGSVNNKGEEGADEAKPEGEAAPGTFAKDKEVGGPDAAIGAPAVTPATVVAVVDEAAADEAEEGSKDGTTSDDGVLVTDGMVAEAAAEGGSSSKGIVAGSSAADGVRGELLSMGFVDPAMINAVLAKNGDEDVEACARDLAAATEWESLLDDLAEMGFGKRERGRVARRPGPGAAARKRREGWAETAVAEAVAASSLGVGGRTQGRMARE